jgi:hypothetical protein
VGERIMDIWEELAEQIAPELTEAVLNVAWGFEQVLGVVTELNKEGAQLPEWMSETARWVQRLQNPVVALNDLLGLLREKSEGARDGMTSLDEIMAIHENTLATLNIEQIQTALSAYALAEAQLTLLASATGLTPAFETQIARVREMRAEMEATAIALTGTTIDVTARRVGTGVGTTAEIAGKEEMSAKELLRLNQERLVVQEQLAQAMLNEQLAYEGAIKIQQTQAMQEQERLLMDRMRALRGVTDRSVDIIVSGFTGGFDNVIDGFKNMLADMAKEWLKSQIFGAIFGVAGKATSGGFFLK